MHKQALIEQCIATS